MPNTTENVPQNTPSGQASRVRSTLIRAGIAGGMALAFVFVASVLEPGASRASEGGLTVALPEGVSRDIPDVFYVVDSTSDLGRSLGELRGRTFRVEIVAGQNGEEPTYRVLDADGNVIADNLRAHEVYSVDPNLTIDRMGDFPESTREMTSGPLMLLEPARD
jgi:hypothetical protein